MSNKIKAARQSLGLTQLQFADKAKIRLEPTKGTRRTNQATTAAFLMA